MRWISNSWPGSMPSSRRNSAGKTICPLLDIIVLMISKLSSYSTASHPNPEILRFMDRKCDKPRNGSGEEIVVFSVVRDSKCTECGAELWKGSLLRLEQEKALCIDCADLGHLEFLPTGDAALTRRSSKYST